ncbi:hypothetical protein FisN_26Hu133 [Fistulifera solaris]|uniref:Uncharacterized protein n=1 Tax=Fistulifera solaris TaxID=1519565 RepID=A0A1Z5JYJ7_FISSO|nr:hypothetical protein FisN_26Hu133 [Fistulifera solaris]|eukprot:GAX18831.1 hypothetical protein FisN_26Hu133 [Fistulifera solaris]
MPVIHHCIPWLPARSTGVHGSIDHEKKKHEQQLQDLKSQYLQLRSKPPFSTQQEHERKLNDLALQYIQLKLKSPTLSKEERAQLQEQLNVLHQPRENHLLASVDILQRAIRVYEDDKGQVASLYYQMGEVYYLLWQSAFSNDDIFSALKWEQRMLEAWEQSKQVVPFGIGYGIVCMRQGAFYTEVAKPMQAYNLLQEGLILHLEPALPSLSGEDLQELQEKRIAGWLNAATAATMLGKFDVALQALQPVLQCYEEEERTGFQDDRLLIHFAQALFSQADLYLQMAQYEKAKESYQTTMEYYQKRSMSSQLEPLISRPILLQGVNVDDDEVRRESIQEYENVLLEASADAALSSSSYEGDHKYVAGLHADLGLLYMRNKEFVLAEVHTRQAIRSYTAIIYTSYNVIGRHLAYAHFILALVLFLRGEFLESAQQRALVCDFYKEVLAEGVNPMLADLDNTENDKVIEMEGKWKASKRTAMSTSTTDSQETEITITTEADAFPHMKKNYSLANDEP